MTHAGPDWHAGPPTGLGVGRTLAQATWHAPRMAKIKVVNPVVEIDGDEMTRIIWQWIRVISVSYTHLTLPTILLV